MTFPAVTITMQNVAAKSTFDLYDELAFDGQLGALLTQWRAAGDTYEAITFQLRQKGVIVSVPTVYRWVQALETERAS